MRLFRLSATYSVLWFLPRVTPVGPITSAAGSVRSENPEPMTVSDSTDGAPPDGETSRSTRTTVPSLTTLPPAATVPLSTFVTNRDARLGWPLFPVSSKTVISHGPLIWASVIVSATLPLLSRTIRHPASAVAAVPSDVGKLPTITQPLRSTTKAVVRPTPPGHAPGRLPGSICAKRLKAPVGEIWTMVVPVPCRLELLLKLLIRILPRTSFPTLRGTRKTPYGLMSPLAGTVEETTVMLPERRPAGCP